MLGLWIIFVFNYVGCAIIFVVKFSQISIIEIYNQNYIRIAQYFYSITNNLDINDY
jgi:hypothetical protein